MELSYRTKDSQYSMGIQVTSKVDENIDDLIKELTDKGFTYEKSRIPLSFPNKDNTTTGYFYRNGSKLFGLKTQEEVMEFINDSSPILRKHDKKFNTSALYFYDND